MGMASKKAAKRISAKQWRENMEIEGSQKYIDLTLHSDFNSELAKLVVQRSCGCPTPGDVQGHGWGHE